MLKLTGLNVHWQTSDTYYTHHEMRAIKTIKQYAESLCWVNISIRDMKSVSSSTTFLSVLLLAEYYNDGGAGGLPSLLNK